ncbi:MAG TPA: hypothetical protein VMT20_07090 [Terriglobia bacterium]|nr:hypothetical protein [Terriglobia bacterium]
MTSISLEIPTVGEKNTVAEPKVGNSIKKVEEFLNSNKLDGATNIKSESIKESNLETTLQEAINKAFAGLTFEQKNASFTAVSGKLYEQIKNSSTVTLPAPTANRYIGIFVGSGTTGVKVKCESGKLYGDAVVGATEVALAGNQHLLVEANGTNWLILAGEVMSEAKYVAIKTLTKVEAEAEVEVSASRPAQVQLIPKENSCAVEVSGISLGTFTGNSATQLTFRLNPGQKFKANKECFYSYILL